MVFLASTAAAGDARPLDGLGWALLAANILPLLALRRAPLLVVVACLSVAYPAWAALEYPTGSPPPGSCGPCPTRPRW